MTDQTVILALLLLLFTLARPQLVALSALILMALGAIVGGGAVAYDIIQQYFL